MRMMRYELLTISKDLLIKSIYKTRENVNAKLKQVWKAKKAAAIATAEVKLNFKFPAQLSNQGIWHRNFNPNPSLSVAHAMSLKQQYIGLQ